MAGFEETAGYSLCSATLKKIIMKECVSHYSNWHCALYFLFLFSSYSIPKLLIRVNKLAIEYNKSSRSLPKGVAGICTNWVMMCLKT